MMKTDKEVIRWSCTLLILICCFHTDTIEATDECINGIALPDGTCDCYSCWMGDSCSVHVSTPPKFLRDHETVTVTDAHQKGQPVYTVVAYDADEAYCKDPEGCPCSKLTYFIANQDGNSNFVIDKNTGVITLAEESFSLYPKYELTIGASDDGAAYATMTLVIQTGKERPEAAMNNFMMEMSDGYLGAEDLRDLAGSDGEMPHSRQRRAITLPQNVSFELTKYGANSAVTNVKVGLRVQFQLDILFPSGTTTMQVELFAPDSTDVIMMLCNVQVTVGSNLNVAGTTTPVMESLDNSRNNDRAIIALGSVDNSASDLNTEEPSTITITYEAVMLNNPNTVDNTEYWVSAGAEYNNEVDVWIGQASFIADTADDSATFTDLPTVNFTGPDTLPVGSAAIYYVDMSISRPIESLIFNLFAPVNHTDVMSICSAKVISVNEAYQCSFGDYWDYVPVYTADGNTQGYGRVTIDLGSPINKYAREYATTPTDDLRGVISFAVQVTMLDNPALVVPSSYWIGATVEIGSQTVWAGQLQVTSDNQATSQVISPNFNITLPNGDGLSTTRPVIIQVDMEVPENTEAAYSLEVMAPVEDGSAVLQVCAVKVIGVGENMACLTHVEHDVQYSISNSSTNIYTDVARVNLGTITNVGSMGWVHPNSSDIPRNTARFHILFKATDHPAATVSSTHDVYFGMFVGTNRLVIGKTVVTVEAPSPADNITASNVPTWAMSFGGDGSDNVIIGHTAKVLLDIKTARNTIYSPFNIEFIMPNRSGEAMLQVCKVELHSVGANNPCVVKEGLEKSVELISSFGDGIHDRAVINRPSLCNYELEDDEAEDHVVLAASVVLRDHPEFQTDPTAWISAGVMYSSTTLWVGQLSITADTGGTLPPLASPPYVAAVPNNNGMTQIPLGYPARFLIRIKMSPNDTSVMSLNVSTTDDALSICSIRFTRAGDGFPCIEAETAMAELFDEDATKGLIRKGSIDLKLLSNVGSEPLTSNTDFDTNTVEVEVVAKLTLDSNVALEGTDHTFEVVVNYDAGYASTTTATATVVATTNTTGVDALTLADSGVTGSLVVGSITGNDTVIAGESDTVIAKSESKRLVFTIDTVFNTTSHLNVTVTTPSAPGLQDAMEVVYIGLFEAGVNLPCLKHAQTEDTYEPWVAGNTYNNVGMLDLGYVCNTGAVQNGTDPTANTFKVEAIVRLLDTDAVSVSTPLTLSAAINSNSQEILVTNVGLTVGDATTYTDVYNDNLTLTDGISVNTTEDPIIMTIAETKVFPVIFKVPSYSSSKVWLDASMPVNTSAIMTIQEVQVVRSGRNIPNLEKYQSEYITTESSKYNTSQMTKYELNMGIVSNGGMTKSRGDFMDDDDTFSLDVTLQMADNVAAQDLSEHKVSFGLHVGRFVFILDMTVQVSRTGSEELLFNVSSTLDEVNSTSDRVEIDTIFRLSNLSTSEGQDSILNLFLPPYVSHTSTEVISRHKSIMSVDNVNNAITLSFGPLFFTDDVRLMTVVESNTSYLVPLGITGLDTVFKYQPVANTHTDVDLAGDIDYVNFTITTSPKGGSDCSPGALGMESGTIKDCQISSSDDSITGSEAVNGRYNVGSGWSPFVHSGKVREERYFQVYFGKKVMINKILMQQSGPAKATKISVRYSNDGLSWIENPDNVLSPDTGLNDEELNLPSPQISSYIRVMITDLNDNTKKATFKFDFVGCETSNAPIPDPCTTVVTQPSKLADFARRSFVVAGATLYVCDGIKGTDGIEQKCYATEDNSIWRELDSRVGSMLGYDSEEPRVYTVSASGLNYMSSTDGLDWYTAVPQDVTAAKALTTYKAATVVPVDGDSRLNLANPDTAFTDSNYGATSVGLKYFNTVWAAVFNWSSCC